MAHEKQYLVADALFSHYAWAIPLPELVPKDKDRGESFYVSFRHGPGDDPSRQDLTWEGTRRNRKRPNRELLMSVQRHSHDSKFRYFHSIVKLLSTLCKGRMKRNRDLILGDTRLGKLFSAERVVAYIKSAHVPYALRAVFLDLLLKLHMDRDPIYPSPLVNYLRLVSLPTTPTTAAELPRLLAKVDHEDARNEARSIHAGLYKEIWVFAQEFIATVSATICNFCNGQFGEETYEVRMCVGGW